MCHAMFSVALLFSMAFGSSVAEVNDFFEKYTYAKTMSVCFGGSAYEEYLLLIAKAKRECSGTSSYASYPKPSIGFNPPYNPSFGQPIYTTMRPTFTTMRPTRRPTYTTRRPTYLSQNPFFTVTSPPITVTPGRPSTLPRDYSPYGQHHQLFMTGFDTSKMNFIPGYTNRPKNQYNQEQLYDSVAISTAVDEISNALRNFTCVLGRLQMIDQSLNINYDMMINNYFRSPIDDQLRTDLISGINYCEQLVTCTPEDKSPISYELQRLMAFIKCEKKTRLSACFKQDLRNNLHHFDTSALPFDGMKTTELEKLMTILIGSESLDQLELF